MDKIQAMVNRIHEEGRKLSSSPTLSTRDMSSMDDLTHNFTEDPAVTRRFLEKCGQVFIFGRRFET